GGLQTPAQRGGVAESIDGRLSRLIIGVQPGAAPAGGCRASAAPSYWDLPGYILFACLDTEGQGQISEDAVCKWATSLCGDPASQGGDAASAAAALCNPTGRGLITYADFRRWCGHMDRQQAMHTGRAAQLQLRAQLREAVLELSGRGADVHHDGIKECCCCC
ncbi:unnamed protein product, partial [Polarella glacialis]